MGKVANGDIDNEVVKDYDIVEDNSEEDVVCDGLHRQLALDPVKVPYPHWGKIGLGCQNLNLNSGSQQIMLLRNVDYKRIPIMLMRVLSPCLQY